MTSKNFISKILVPIWLKSVVKFGWAKLHPKGKNFVPGFVLQDGQFRYINTNSKLSRLKYVINDDDYHADIPEIKKKANKRFLKKFNEDNKVSFK